MKYFLSTVDKPANPNSAKKTLLHVVNIGIGGTIGWFLGHFAFSEPYGIGFLGFLGLFALAIALHELGHVLGAFRVNFRVCSFTVGPITIHWSGGRAAVRWGAVRIGGLVTLAPNGIQDLLRRMLIVTAYGPAASLVFGIIAFGIGLLLPESSIAGGLQLTGLMSLALGLLSLIPSRKFYSSDGAKMWDLWRGKERGERQCAILALLADLNSGTRPRDLNADLIQRVLTLQDGTGMDLSSYMWAFYWAKDRHDFDAAQQYLEAVIERVKICPPSTKASIALDAAFFYALIRGDSAAGRKWFDSSKKRFVTEKYFLLTTEAAVLLSEGKSSEALAAANKAMKALPRATFLGFAIARRIGWNSLRPPPRKTATASNCRHFPPHTRSSYILAARGWRLVPHAAV